MQLPGMGGIDLFEKVSECRPETEVVILPHSAILKPRGVRFIWTSSSSSASRFICADRVAFDRAQKRIIRPTTDRPPLSRRKSNRPTPAYALTTRAPPDPASAPASLRQPHRGGDGTGHQPANAALPAGRIPRPGMAGQVIRIRTSDSLCFPLYILAYRRGRQFKGRHQWPHSTVLICTLAISPASPPRKSRRSSISPGKFHRRKRQGGMATEGTGEQPAQTSAKGGKSRPVLCRIEAGQTFTMLRHRRPAARSSTSG